MLNAQEEKTVIENGDLNKNYMVFTDSVLRVFKNTLDKKCNMNCY